jgi:hypothetical protein
MSKLSIYSKANSSITAEKFTKLCEQLDKDDNLARVYQIVEIMIPQEADLIIHAQNDLAFRNAIKHGYDKLARLLLERTPDTALRNQMIHTQNDEVFKQAAAPTREECTYVGGIRYNPYLMSMYGPYGAVIYGSSSSCPPSISRKTILEDGNEDLISLFLELDTDYFDKLANTLKLTPKTAAFIAKSVPEIKLFQRNRLSKTIQDSVGTKLPHIPNVIADLIAQYENATVEYPFEFKSSYTAQIIAEREKAAKKITGCCIC